MMDEILDIYVREIGVSLLWGVPLAVVLGVIILRFAKWGQAKIDEMKAAPAVEESEGVKRLEYFFGIEDFGWWIIYMYFRGASLVGCRFC